MNPGNSKQWSLNAVAFAAVRGAVVVSMVVLTSVGGCAHDDSSSSSRARGPAPVFQGDVLGFDTPAATITQPSQPAAPQTPGSMIFADTSTSAALSDGPAPRIDIFGEFNGKPHAGNGVMSEAGYQQHTYVDEGRDDDVAADPTGKWIAFSSTRHSEHSDIYLQRVDGVSVIQLTSDPADDASPVFSADGKQIAFCSTRSGNWDIYVMDTDGKGVVQVTNSPAQDIHPSFSPDGTKLVYCSMGSRSGQWELWVADLTTNQKRMIGFGLFPSWSPDHGVDRIAFQRARQRGSRWFSLWTLDLVDGEARRVTEVTVSSNAAIVCPTWSPDGRRLAFSTIVDPASASNGKPASQTDIWAVNADGTNRHRLTDGVGLNATPYWGADNRVYFVSDRGGADCVWSVQADGELLVKHNTRAPAVGSVDTSEIGR